MSGSERTGDRWPRPAHWRWQGQSAPPLRHRRRPRTRLRGPAPPRPAASRAGAACAGRESWTGQPAGLERHIAPEQRRERKRRASLHLRHHVVGIYHMAGIDADHQATDFEPAGLPHGQLGQRRREAPEPCAHRYAAVKVLRCRDLLSCGLQHGLQHFHFPRSSGKQPAPQLKRVPAGGPRQLVDEALAGERVLRGACAPPQADPHGHGARRKRHAQVGNSVGQVYKRGQRQQVFRRRRRDAHRQRQRIARLVKGRLHPDKARGPVEVMPHVLLAAPQGLHWDPRKAFATATAWRVVSCMRRRPNAPPAGVRWT
jgi:hypothetical protein